MECTSLTNVDLSSFDTSNVTYSANMFGACSKLKTIYVGDKWNLSNVTQSSTMFYNCTAIVGPNGTKYNSNYLDKTYACVDTAAQKGYLTHK